MYGPDGAALSGANVTTIPASVSASTAADGTATLADVPIGNMYVTANKTGLKADGTAVTVVAGGTVTATLRLEDASEFALARVVGITNGYQDLLPNGEIRITSNTASKSGYDIKTDGIANVAVKSYVYLRGATEDSAGNAITAMTWSKPVCDGSKAGDGLQYWDPSSVDTSTAVPTRLWSAVTWDPTASTSIMNTGPGADMRFRPDVPGVYRITVTATAGGVTSTYHLNIYAGNYVGVAWCASCHSNPTVVGDTNAVYDIWALTGHATKFENTYSSYSYASDYCVQCHTTGYDESTLSGFDNMARESGWDPNTTSTTTKSVLGWAKSNWPTLSAFIADPVTEPMQKLMNIQCESCHGPGSNHPTAASHMTWDPSTCAQCHAQQNQWALSGHAYYVSPKEWASSSCMPCHSGQGFVVAKVQNKPIVFPDESFDGNPATVFEKGLVQGIGCVTCHDPHLGTGTKSSQLRLEETSFTAPMGFTVTAKESAACKTCHVDKRDTTYFNAFLAGNQSRGPHGATQVDMLSGHGGAEFSGKTYSSSSHTSDANASECITCHMYVGTGASCTSNSQCDPTQVCSHGLCTDQNFGGHTFNMTYTTAGGTEYEHVAACSPCHGTVTSFDRSIGANYSGSGGGVQTQIDTLLARLGGKLQFGTGAVVESGIDKLSPKPSQTQLQALWNYWFVTNDKSHGVHNTKYAAQLLCDSLKALDPNDACSRQ